jgi:RNA polymerase sigma-70 factor (ECF subfamily)
MVSSSFASDSKRWRSYRNQGIPESSLAASEDTAERVLHEGIIRKPGWKTQDLTEQVPPWRDPFYWVLARPPRCPTVIPGPFHCHPRADGDRLSSIIRSSIFRLFFVRNPCFSSPIGEKGIEPPPAVNREEVFKAWIEDYGGILSKMVRAYAFTPQDEDDLLQEIALQLWLSIPRFEGRSQPSTWIYKVALNTAFVWKRKEGKHPKDLNPLSEEMAIGGSGVSPSGNAQHREDLVWLYEELRKLDKIDRSVVLLYLEDMSYREMGEILGISENHVGVRLNRLRKRLAEEYARRSQ